MTETPPDTASEDDVPAPVAKPKRRWFRNLLISFVLVVLMTGGGALALFKWAQGVYGADGPLSESAVLVIEPGSGLQKIARSLEAVGVIQQPEVFIAMLRYSGDHTRLTAGEYLFPAGISQADVARMLIEHDVVNRFVTIPEGLTVVEAMALVEEADGLEGPMPALPSEGSILPETYQYVRGESRSDLVARMEKEMRDTVATLWEGRAADLPYSTPEEAITLASIIEKETGVDGERAKVAGVFINRLRRGMRLQSDPTVVFALTEGKAPLGRSLTRQDWKVDHPYNTYRIPALPPGPIANPGREALEAAMNPAATKAIYFVADGTGGHAFAETLAEHNRNVAKWRKVRDAQN